MRNINSDDMLASLDTWGYDRLKRYYEIKTNNNIDNLTFSFQRNIDYRWTQEYLMMKPVEDKINEIFNNKSMALLNIRSEDRLLKYASAITLGVPKKELFYE
jgi:hypothetical protein